MNLSGFKKKVKNYWNRASCGTEFIKEDKYSKKYFDAIEEFRYKIEPEIFSFAQFTRFRNKKVLEVGVGAGTDFIQWVRSGCKAYGIDLTEEALDNTKKRLSMEGLKAENLSVADAETISFDSEMFDLVYSWGVIHHSKDPFKILREMIRVTKKGGTIKLMIYNRYSLFSFYRWLMVAFLKGKPFISLKKVLFYNQESYGTKAYTKKEFLYEIKNLPVQLISLDRTVSSHDLLYYKPKIYRSFAYVVASLFGWKRVGWFMKIELKKT